jgi:hypothetical protein
LLFSLNRATSFETDEEFKSEDAPMLREAGEELERFELTEESSGEML